MSKHDALQHLLVAVVNTSFSGTMINSKEEALFNKLMKTIGIPRDYDGFLDYFENGRFIINGLDSTIEEALKVTKGCRREWRVEVYGYMCIMAKWDHDHDFSNIDENKLSENELTILFRTREYLGITEEEDDPEVRAALHHKFS